MSINGNQLFVCSVEMRVKNQLSGQLDRKTDHFAGVGNMVILSFNNTPPASRWISAPRGVALFNSIEFEGIVRADHFAGVGKMIRSEDSFQYDCFRRDGEIIMKATA